MKKGKKPLTTSKVKFSYKDKAVLEDITLKLKKGELVAIIGKSGSGKSTLLKLIAGIISKRKSGKIRIFGLPRFFKKSKIGFVPQESAFIPDLSIEDNIKIMGANSGLREAQAISKAREYMNLLKLDESLSKKPSELSGGQKVRLNILLSFLHEPELLILDEPFVGLDFKNRRLLWHFLTEMKKKGKSIVLTSHLLAEIQEHVDRIIILRNGVVFFTGGLEKLKQKLKINYLIEYKFTHLSKEAREEINKYCIYKDLEILDHYNKYFMFGIHSTKQRSTLETLFKKLKLNFEEIGFREPNLDEVFLKE
jgi:ABC-type multidrug transport system ATPase subunit